MTSSSRECGFWDDLVDDIGAFDAALAFVDDFTTQAPTGIKTEPVDIDMAELPTTSESESSDGPKIQNMIRPPQQPQQHPPTKRPRRRRDRVREELLQLRQTVEILQQQHDALSIMQALEEPSDDETEGSTSPNEMLMWEAVAKRQREEEQRAQEENQRLRARLQKHLQVAKAWERLLQRGNSVDDVPSMTPSAEMELLALPLDDIELFDEMESRVEMLHDQIDSVRADPQFARALGSSRTANIRSEGNGLPTEVESFISEIVPFDLETSDSATWKFLSQHYARDFSAMYGDWKKDDDPNVIRRCYKLDLNHPRVAVNVDGKAVIKRYIENDCIVIVSTSLLAPHSVAGVSMEGVMLRKDSWSVLSRFNDDDTIATQFASKHISSVVGYARTPHVLDKLQLLTNFVAAAVNLRVDAGLQLFENLLMDFKVKRKDDEGNECSNGLSCTIRNDLT